MSGCLPIVEVEFPPTFTSGAGVAGPSSSSGSLGIGQAQSPDAALPGATPNPGAGCPASTGVIRVMQKAPVRVRLPIKDELGNVFQDIGGTDFEVDFTVRESEYSRAVVQVDADSVENGYAIVTLPGIRLPGLYLASVNVAVAGEPAAHTRYWVEVAKSFKWRAREPLSIAEVRLEVRDQCGAQNELLDRLKFTDEQVAWAIRKPVDEFNSTGQPQTAFTAANFPGAWRAPWASAAAGYLLRVASIGDDRDGLQYQAGGVSVDDKNISFVAKMSQTLLEEWRKWMRVKKVEINVEGAWGTLGSDYGSGSWV